MTNPPASVTIGGETLSAEDWPECSYFQFDQMNEIWRFEFPDPLNPASRADFPDLDSLTDVEFYSTPVRITDCKPHELRVAAAVARCYFLDKAEAELKTIPDTEDWIVGKLASQHIAAKERAARYLASAAKWARIGKTQKTSQPENRR